MSAKGKSKTKTQFQNEIEELRKRNAALEAARSGVPECSDDRLQRANRILDGIPGNIHGG